MFKVKKNRVLFTSDSRDVIGGNFEQVYNRMLERNLTEKLEIVTLFKKSIHEKRKIWDKIKMPYYLATSKIIILDDYHPMIYKVDYSKEQEIVQLWHACGYFKTVGFSRLGKQGGLDISALFHRVYTSVSVSSEASIQYYSEAFGVPEKNIKVTGIPRVDVFFNNKEKHLIKQKIRKYYTDIDFSKEIILIAPTYRGEGPKTAFYPFYEQFNVSEMVEYAKKNNSIFLLKMHPFVNLRFNFNEEESLYIRDVSNYREVNDLLFVTDVLVTDYSSVIFEYSIFEKPMIFYSFDLEEYKKTRDFYIEYENFIPGEIVSTFGELMKAISCKEIDYEKIIRFKNENFPHQDSGATDRVIDELIMKEVKVEKNDLC